MGVRITDLKHYRAQFPDRTKRKYAYKLALEIRQFEIELYWKRATYFWTLIAATFAGYFALATSQGSHSGLVFLVSCIGLVLSTSWYLVNRGSKYWQENWERHVDLLEDEFVGPLYKTTIANQQFCGCKPEDGYRFSVSKVNQLTSLYVALVWLGLTIISFLLSLFPASHFEARLHLPCALTLFVFTFAFLRVLFVRGRGGSQGKERGVDFYKSPIVPSAKQESKRGTFMCLLLFMRSLLY